MGQARRNGNDNYLALLRLFLEAGAVDEASAVTLTYVGRELAHRDADYLRACHWLGQVERRWWVTADGARAVDRMAAGQRAGNRRLCGRDYRQEAR